MKRVITVALLSVGLAATAVATHSAIDTDGHTTLEQTLRPKAGDESFKFLELGPGEPHIVRDAEPARAQAGRDKRRVSLAYLSQLTDFQLADEESPARVEFADPAASSAHRPQEGLTPFQIEATIRQINRYAAASPVTQGDGTRNKMDFALITGDQADNSHLNETVWVRDLLEGNGPTNFNSGVTDPAFYADPTNLNASCNAYVLLAGAEAVAAEAARYTGVQDYDDYPAGAPQKPLYYDPDNPMGKFAEWPDYGNLLDRAQQIEIDPEGLKVPFYITNGNHDVLVQGNEDANAAFEDIALGCFKALGSTIEPTAPEPDPNLLLSPLNLGMIVPPDPGRQFVDKLQVKEIYGATAEGPADDDHGFKHVDPDENAESANSASYYAWDPEQTPGMRFISIDTNSEGGQTAEGVAAGSSNGNLDDPQFQWLKRELQAAKTRNQLVVIFGHHPVRSMSTEIRDEQAAPCTGVDDGHTAVEGGHAHDVNPGCDLDPRPSDDDPDTPGFGCIHNGFDSHNNTCPAGHESFEELIDGFPNVVAYVPGHTHEHKLTPFPRTDGSVWWEINTSAVIDHPNQSRLIELMDNRDGTLSWFNTVVDHASPATAPGGCAPDSTTCASAFTEPELASIGRTLTYNDHHTTGSGAPEDRNAELLLGDPRPLADLGVTLTDAPDPATEGRPLTYVATVTNTGANESRETVLTGELTGVTVTAVSSSAGECDPAAARVECRIGTLAGGASATVTITATAGKPGEASGSVAVRGNVSDRVAGNDADRETTTVVAAPPPVETPTQTPTATPDGGEATATPTATATASPTATPTATATPGPGPPPPGLLPCTARAFDRVEVRPLGRRLDFDFDLVRGATNARVDVFQSSSGRRVLGERLVARFSARTEPFVWSGKATRARRRVTDGIFFARFTSTDARGLRDVRRRVLERRNGRWSRRAAFEKRVSCTLTETFKLERPVFGGTSRRGLRAAYRLNRSGRVRIEVLRGSRVVRRFRERARPAGRTFRVRVDRGLRRRGDYRIRLTARRDGEREIRVLVSRRL